MDKIQLHNNEDIIDYVAKNQENSKGRKIYTNAEMVKRLSTLTENITKEGKSIIFDIICPETGNSTKVDMVREGSDCYWLKEITADDIAPIGPVDKTKEPIHVINVPTIDKSILDICK